MAFLPSSCSQQIKLHLSFQNAVQDKILPLNTPGKIPQPLQIAKFTSIKKTPDIEVYTHNTQINHEKKKVQIQETKNFPISFKLDQSCVYLTYLMF